MDKFPLEKVLKDGTKVTIREMQPEDELKLLNFFKSLPLEERQYLRMDVTQIEYLRRRMHPGPFQRIWRLVAEHDDKIWADATLCGHVKGWMRHVSEIRCIVHPSFQRKELGKFLISELYQKTVSDKGQRIVCEAVPEQTSAIAVLKSLGFHLVLVRKDHIKDINGKKHDLHIYSIDVKEMWERLRAYFQKTDIGYPP